jgi:hypothetical protein
LTLRDPPGADLRVWDGSDPELAAEAAVTSAYHLLRRGFEGRSFPVPADPGAVVVDRSGQVTWTGGPFASLPPLSRGRLKRYLLAVADGDADAAFDLLAEEVPVAGAAEEEVRRRLRQTVAWREEGATGAGGLTAELFAHMRGARQDGIAPSTPWLTLGQSLAGLAPTWRRMAPATDPVREALTRLTAAEMVDEVTRLAAPGPWGRRAGLTAAAVLSLPSQLDALLAGGEPPSVRLRIAPPAPAPGDHRERVARLGWLAVAAALGLLWRPLGGATGLPPPAVEAVAAVLILVCGLRVLGRGRRRRGGPIPDQTAQQRPSRNST